MPGAKPCAAKTRLSRDATREVVRPIALHESSGCFVHDGMTLRARRAPRTARRCCAPRGASTQTRGRPVRPGTQAMVLRARSITGSHTDAEPDSTSCTKYHWLAHRCRTRQYFVHEVWRARTHGARERTARGHAALGPPQTAARTMIRAVREGSCFVHEVLHRLVGGRRANEY